jgi:hypothetical protein
VIPRRRGHSEKLSQKRGKLAAIVAQERPKEEVGIVSSSEES